MSRPHLAGGRSDAHRTERASATPQGPGATPARGSGRPVTMGRGLRAQLAWFQAAVTGPRAPAADGVLTRPELLEVYRYAYTARLEEALADDFEAVRSLAGPDWSRLVSAYVRDCPPVTATLNDYGARFPAWLRARRRPLLADLATLEWALVEVLHAPAAPVLDLAALANLPLERWETARFLPAGTLRVVVSRWPINGVLDEVRAGTTPKLPGRSWSATAVYRRGFDLWRQPLTRPAHRVLSRLMTGATLETALAGLRSTAATEVMPWFADWVGNGFFAAIKNGRRP